VLLTPVQVSLGTGTAGGQIATRIGKLGSGSASEKQNGLRYKNIEVRLVQAVRLWTGNYVFCSSVIRTSLMMNYYVANKH
jgi:hypothetical protein